MSPKFGGSLGAALNNRLPRVRRLARDSAHRRAFVQLCGPMLPTCPGARIRVENIDAPERSWLRRACRRQVDALRTFCICPVPAFLFHSRFLFRSTSLSLRRFVEHVGGVALFRRTFVLSR